MTQRERENAVRLSSALQDFSCNAQFVERLARLLNYSTEQLCSDMSVLYPVLRELLDDYDKSQE